MYAKGDVPNDADYKLLQDYSSATSRAKRVGWAWRSTFTPVVDAVATSTWKEQSDAAGLGLQ